MSGRTYPSHRHVRGQWRTVRQAFRRVLPTVGEGMWDRRLTRTADVVVTGHPKVGTTWTRFLLAYYAKEAFALSNTPLFEDAGRWARARGVGLPSVAIHFTHGGLRWRTQTGDDLRHATVVEPYARRTTVLLTRHPLDALVSNYYYRTRRATAVFQGDISAFLADPVWGVDKYIRFHNLWAPELSREDVMLIRYEDTMADTGAQLVRLVEHCGWAVDPDAVLAAVAAADIDEMRKLEASADAPNYASSGIPVFSPSEDPDARKVRRGRVGGWRDEILEPLASELVKRIDGELDPAFGYQS